MATIKEYTEFYLVERSRVGYNKHMQWILFLPSADSERDAAQ